MGQQRYSIEFKDEAVKQVTERGHSVQEVASRLGVSSHSLYKWVKSVRPSKEERRGDELLDAKKEILKLRAELRRVQGRARHPKKSRGVLCKGARVKYAFIHANRDRFPIRTLCRVLEVVRSGFYAWVQKPLSDRAIEDERLLGLIRESYRASDRIYGSPRVFLDLREAGERVGRKRVARIMREHRIRAVRGYKTPRHLVSVPSAVAPNRLQRQFSFDEPDHGWVTDITYIRTWEGWFYLTVVMDLHSRKIIGWSMQQTRARDLVLDALLMAVWRRKPRQQVIVHSDQGSQYGSDDWVRFCKAHKLDPSMSRRGNCWDNAVAESFFSSLKKEKIRKKIYRTRELAKADIFDYIEVFYNRSRRHSHLGGVSPETFEAASNQRL